MFIHITSLSLNERKWFREQINANISVFEISTKNMKALLDIFYHMTGLDVTNLWIWSLLMIWIIYPECEIIQNDFQIIDGERQTWWMFVLGTFVFCWTAQLGLTEGWFLVLVFCYSWHVTNSEDSLCSSLGNLTATWKISFQSFADKDSSITEASLSIAINERTYRKINQFIHNCKATHWLQLLFDNEIEC